MGGAAARLITFRGEGRDVVDAPVDPRFALGLETGMAGRTGSTIGMIMFLCLIGGPAGLRGDFGPPFTPPLATRTGDVGAGGVGRV